MMVILGEKLRCISDKLHWFEFNNIYEVVAINGSGSDMKISFKNCEIEIHACQLDLFERIPAVQKYTFDDLIDVAVKANKDQVINGFTVVGAVLNCQTLDGEDYNLGIGCEVAHGIEYLQSLYKETFVIERDNDVNKIKNGESILILKNGKAFKFSELMDIPPSLLHDIIFGSTVEQSKC